MEHLVILGNGITGVTVARHVRKQNSDVKISVISSESEYFFSRTALMYIYMGHMTFENTKPYEDWFWKKNRLELLYGYVTEIDSNKKILKFSDERSISFDKLVIATGSQSNKFGWPGQDLPGVQGMYSLQDLKLLEQNTLGISHAVIIGGGLIGIELAEMLISRKIPTTFLVRETSFWNLILPAEEANLVSRHIVEHGIDLRLETELKEIVAGEDGHVNAVITNKDEQIDCQFVGLTVGVHPNIDAVKKSEIETNRGVLVNDYLETNIPDIYAAGDCAEKRVETEGARNRIEQLWYTGRMQAAALAKTILGDRTAYDRGIWFNSAKFLDIEYQTYGFVGNKPREGEQNFYWEHQDGKICLRIVYDKKDLSVTGINVFGIRLRHMVCERWIHDKRTISYVLSHLREANFDPEFFHNYESEIFSAYQTQNPDAHLKVSVA